MQNDTELIKSRFQNPGNERALLSCVLQHPDLMVEAAAKVAEDDFLSSHHKALYAVMYSLHNSGVEKFDLVTLINEAGDKRLLDVIGGPEYISALWALPVVEDNFRMFLTKVLDASTKYKLYRTTENIQQKILNNLSADALPSEELIAQAEGEIVDVSVSSKKIEDAIDMGASLRERLESLASDPREIVGYSSGIQLLDSLISGLSPGDLAVFAARAKVGKSTLLLNMASHIAYNLGVPVLYIDTEMNTDSQQLRMISHLSQVPEKHIKTGQFINDENACARIDKACKVIDAAGPFYHRYFPGFTVEALRSIVKKYHVRNGIGAFFFDYIKIPDSSNLSLAKEHQYLGFLATTLKDLAGELGIPVITAAQINRDGSGKSHHTEDVIADSDRILRYCSHLFALARKSQEEVEKDGLICGTHRLQLLASRGNTSFYDGINLDGRLATCTFRQSEHQPPDLLSIVSR